MDTPSKILADKIAKRLISEGLMTTEEAKKILPKLAAGKLSAEDWKLSIDLSRKKEARP